MFEAFSGVLGYGTDPQGLDYLPYVDLPRTFLAEPKIEVEVSGLKPQVG